MAHGYGMHCAARVYVLCASMPFNSIILTFFLSVMGCFHALYVENAPIIQAISLLAFILSTTISYASAISFGKHTYNLFVDE